MACVIESNCLIHVIVHFMLFVSLFLRFDELVARCWIASVLGLIGVPFSELSSLLILSHAWSLVGGSESPPAIVAMLGDRPDAGCAAST